MASALPVIQTVNLTKAYPTRKGTTLALNNLTLAVKPGEIFGYLGPNGAGKTTTIRLLLDLIRPTRGSATALGMDTQAQSVEIHRRVGYLPGELNLWDRLTGWQVVHYAARVRGRLDTAYVNQLAERLLLDLSLRVRSYSSGNRRKLGLVLALMHRPELLILDEPTNGLDPLIQQTFHELMREARNDGRTVFLSSHMLSEVQMICDRVAILRGGELQAVERVSQLIQADFRWVTVRLREPVSLSLLANVPGVTDISGQDGALTFRLAGDFDPVMRAIAPHYVQDIRTREPSLEEIFLTFYGGAQPAREAAR